MPMGRDILLRQGFTNCSTNLSEGGVAWFDEDLDTTRLGRGRGSGVLVRDPNGEWKVAQYNLSIPIPNERFDEVQKIIERR